MTINPQHEWRRICLKLLIDYLKFNKPVFGLLCFTFIVLTKALCPYHYIDSNFENIWDVAKTEPTVHLSIKKLNGKKAKLNVMIVEQDIYFKSLMMLWHFIISLF